MEKNLPFIEHGMTYEVLYIIAEMINNRLINRLSVTANPEVLGAVQRARGAIADALFYLGGDMGKLLDKDQIVEKIKVVEVDRYRDGGTVVYEDELGRRYWQWHRTKKVYNQWPFPQGNVGTNDVPPPYVKELKVELIVVEKF